MHVKIKLGFVVGAATGLLVGMKIGPQGLDFLKSKLSTVSGKPEVRDALDKAESTVREKVPAGDAIADKAKDKLSDAEDALDTPTDSI
jgi:hypothetical protein